MFGSVAIILINYKDYAKKYLAECLDSLKKQDYQGMMKIFIVDNETSEESINFIKNIVETRLIASLPVEIIRNKYNDGFAKGNNDAMRLALAQEFNYIFLLNMDTVVEENCVSEMVKVFNNNEMDPRLRGDDRKEINPPSLLYHGGNKKIGAVQARLMLWPEKNKINSLGNATHFLGFGFGTKYNEIYSGQITKKKANDIFYPSGAAVMFKAEVLEEIGLFDEEFWMYNEDQDLGWRIWLAGYRCVLASEAVVYHKYQFNKSIRQYYWMDRNRIINILKYYHFTTLLLIFPAFIIMEVGLILFSLRSGWFKEKMRMCAYFLRPKKWAYLHRARKNTQKLRKVKDREIVQRLSGNILHQEVDGDIKLKLINPVFNWYWNLIKKIIWW